MMQNYFVCHILVVILLLFFDVCVKWLALMWHVDLRLCFWMQVKIPSRWCLWRLKRVQMP